jgi:hypothetical protein
LFSSETGCILLLDDDASDKTDTSLADLKAFFGVLSALVCKALPLKVVRVLIISSPSMTTPARAMHSEYAQLIVKNSLSTQVVLMKEDSPQELVDKLKSFGLTKAGLPSVLGGTFGAMGPPAAMMAEGFSFDHPPYESYHSNATHFDSRAYAPPVSPAEEWSASSSSTIHEEEEKASQAPPPTLKRTVTSSGQEQGSNKKIKAYSRTKNNDSSQPSDCKEEDSPPCPQDDSKTTTASHSRQQEAVVVVDKKAKKEIDDHRLKERNALYSRRKYERKKIEIEVMKKEASRHRIQNANLLQEQQCLEHLYAKAMKCIKKHEEREDRKGVEVQDVMQQQQPHHASMLAAARGSPPPSHSASQRHASILAVAATAASASSSPLPCLRELGAVRSQEMLDFHEWLGAEASSGCKVKTTIGGSSFGAPP